MTDDALSRLQAATVQREALRRKWDLLRNHELLALTVLSVPRMTHTERCGVFVASPDGKEVWLEAGTNVTERQISVRDDDSMVGEVLRSGDPLHRQGLGDAPGAHRLVSSETSFTVREALTVPIRNVAGTAVVGALQVLNRTIEGPCGPQEVEVLEEVAFLLQETVERLHRGQELLDAAGDLDRRIEDLDRTESALRGDRVLRTFEPADPMDSGGFLHHRFRGTAYPPFIDAHATQALLDSWDTEEHDVFVCTHQKVGTHLAKKFLVEISRALFDYPATHPMASGDIGHGTVPWPEVFYSQHGKGRWDEFLKRTAGLPRLWYLHCAYGNFPARRIHPRSRFIVIVRDPRAAAVSQYYFWTRHPLLQVPPDLDLDGFTSMFLGGDLYFGDYHRHVLGWLRRADARVSPEQLLVLRFEDLVARKLQVVDRLVEFLAPGRVLPPEVCRAVADSTDFKTMKAQLTKNPGTFHLNPKVFFRAGKARDWEERLSSLAVEAIDQKTSEVWGFDDLTCPPLDGLQTLA